MFHHYIGHIAKHRQDRPYWGDHNEGHVLLIRIVKYMTSQNIFLQYERKFILRNLNGRCD